MLIEIARWLDGAAFSQWLRHMPGAVQILKTVHILAMAALLGSALLLNLRLMGVRRGGDTPAHLARRFLPVHWIGLAVMAASGVMLVAAEPGELMFSQTFGVKLMLIAVALALMLALGALLRTGTPLSTLPRGRRALLFVLGLVSLLLWIAIAVAGRFIAYLW